ncbi:MAG: DUF4157 domain-containing protein [Algibacter sp.]
MNTHADKTQENKSQSVASLVSQKQSMSESTFQFVDNRPEAVAQRKLQEMANNSPQVKQAAQLQAMVDNRSTQQQPIIQKKQNKTGLPDNLKTGIESLSGYSMGDVKVHYNSDKPAQLQAHAYAQSTDIHIASGQEKHLPHEAWHVVQQKQGMVKPTMQMKGKVNVNDDVGLEKEADVMGTKSLQMKQVLPNFVTASQTDTPVVQRMFGGFAEALAARNQRAQNAAQQPARTLTTELTEINQALTLARFTYTVPDEQGLRAAKRAAGLAATVAVAIDFDAFRDRLFTGLRLGAFNNIDGDNAVKAEYAKDLKQNLFDLSSQLKRKKVQADQKFEDYDVTFNDCINWAQCVIENSVHELTTTSLAKTIVSKLGKGLLAGVFPGEAEEANPEQAGDDRLEVMLKFGQYAVTELNDIDNIKPELTGSLILKSGGYTGTPEDIDVNITTTGNEDERKATWVEVIEAAQGYQGESIDLDEGHTIRVFKMAESDVQGKIIETRYGYSLNYLDDDDLEGIIVPIDLEVKDVGGEVWTEHLSDNHEKRTADKEGLSQPKWILLDTLTRILAHKKNMKDGLRKPDLERLQEISPELHEATWKELVVEEGLTLSRNKKLWEKMSVSTIMSEEKLGKAESLVDWIFTQIKGSKLDEYEALFNTVRGNRAYEKWLSDI